jgi:TolB protein
MSPDGKYVAFTQKVKSEVDRKFRYELFLMDNVSKKTIQLTHLNQNISFPRFYHHQDKIIFANDANWLKGKRVWELWEINIDGTGLKKIDLPISKAK